METDPEATGSRAEDEEEEYVLFDLDDIIPPLEIPPNAPYTLHGLTTSNPILIINKKIKLIGEYEETVGTCYVFAEDEAAAVVHEETGVSDKNLFSGRCILDPDQSSIKQLHPIASLNKILKFKQFDFLEEDENDDLEGM